MTCLNCKHERHEVTSLLRERLLRRIAQERDDSRRLQLLARLREVESEL
jgi:hypothetical protein